MGPCVATGLLPGCRMTPWPDLLRAPIFWPSERELGGSCGGGRARFWIILGAASVSMSTAALHVLAIG